MSWKDFVDSPLPRPPFLIDPLVPEGSIVFLHGKTSVGKSPLTWEMARCLATGEDFLGLPTRVSQVAYLELDTPAPLVQERLKLLPVPTGGVYFSFLGVINILNIAAYPKVEKELASLASLKPDVVFINTLRKAFHSSANDSDVPARVYGAFQRLFPGSAFVFVHHDRKDSHAPNARDNQDEMFSGSGAWNDGAQVGLHLMRSGKHLRLDITKSQVSEKFSIPLKLDPNGTFVTRLEDANMEEVERVLASATPGLPTRELDAFVAKTLGVSERSVRTYRLRLAKAGRGASRPLG